MEIIEVDKQFLAEVLYTLNNIPNHKKVGPNLESSYEMAKKLHKIVYGTKPLNKSIDLDYRNDERGTL